MVGADEASVNRMIQALEPYVCAAIREDRWHSWISEPSGCGSVEIIRWVPVGWPQPRDVLGFTAFMSSPNFGGRGIGRQLTQTIIAWCRERGFEWIYLHASDQGRPLYQSLGFTPCRG